MRRVTYARCTLTTAMSTGSLPVASEWTSSMVQVSGSMTVIVSSSGLTAYSFPLAERTIELGPISRVGV